MPLFFNKKHKKTKTQNNLELSGFFTIIFNNHLNILFTVENSFFKKINHLKSIC